MDDHRKTKAQLLSELDALRDRISALESNEVAPTVPQELQDPDDFSNSIEIFQSILDNIPELVFWKDLNLVYRGCNQTFADRAGLSCPSDVIGKTDFDLPWREFAPLYKADDEAIIGTGTPRLNYEEPTVQTDGSQFWVRTNKAPLHDRNGKIIGIIGAAEDIMDRKEAEQELEKANEKLIQWIDSLERTNHESLLLRQMGDLLQVCNNSEEYFTIIKEFSPQLFPLTSGALFMLDQPRKLVEAIAIWGDDLQTQLVFAPDECWALRRGQPHQVKLFTPGLSCQHILQPFNGGYLDIPMMASGETIGLFHIEGDPEMVTSDSMRSLVHTVAEHLSLSYSNLKLRETLRFQSIRDPLTGLFNRRYMEETFDRELPRAIRKRYPVGIIMLDIDHFKIFNDTYGHKAGDVVLHELGTLLKRHVRVDDIACRYGGEEFILIMPDASLDVTVQRAELIRQAVSAMSVEYLQQPLGIVTVSIGVAVFPEHDTDPAGILQKADQALYLAKHNGRDRVEIVRNLV